MLVTLEVAKLNISAPDIRIFACPSTEGLELTLRLAHPCVKEVEFSESSCSSLSITVNGIESFMVFHKADHIVFIGGSDKFVMVGKELRSWFCNQNVDFTFDRIQADGVMSAY